MVIHSSLDPAATATTAAPFTAAEGQITGPNGTPFLARGIGVIDGTINSHTAGQILSELRGINMVRLAIEHLQAPLSPVIQSFIQQMTSAGVVVEIEDHTAPSVSRRIRNNVPSGLALRRELAWYSSLARQYAGNPYVWFGTMNEPGDTADKSRVSAQEQEIYDAVRNAGNTNPIMLEQIRGFTDSGLVAADYANMTNVIWDTHVYGWESHYSTNQATVSNATTAQIADAQSIGSAEGKIPVIIGETGPTTNPGKEDPNASQVAAAVENSGLGVLFWGWGWGDGVTGDSLNNADGTLNSYAKQVAAWIASKAGIPAKTYRR